MKRKLVVIGALWIVVPWTVQIVIDRRRRSTGRSRETAADAG